MLRKSVGQTEYLADWKELQILWNINRCMLDMNFDAVGWVIWPVKPTTESENRLQLGSLSTSVNIDRLTMVDNTSAVGNDSHPWVVPQSIKWLSTITRERWIPPDLDLGGFPHLFGTSLYPHIGSCLTGSSWQRQQQQHVMRLRGSNGLTFRL